MSGAIGLSALKSGVVDNTDINIDVDSWDLLLEQNHDLSSDTTIDYNWTHK